MSRLRWRPLAALVCAALLAAAPAALRAEPGSADQAVQQARQAARENRHADAIGAFGRALQAAPGRRHEWLLEWADQHTWAGRLGAAIGLYREALRNDVITREPAGLQRARIGLARALSWKGQHGQALAVYAAALAADPQDREARLGQARVLSWRGRHREAAAAMQRYLKDHPRDREAVLVLAESLAWMGRGDRALPVLREQVAADPGDTRAAALLQRQERELRPQASADLRHFDQSDRLRIQDLSLAGRRAVHDGRGLVGVRFGATRFTPPAGPVQVIEVLRPGVDARWRFSDAIEWNGSVGFDAIDTRGASGDHVRLVHDTYLTWRPHDVLRVDLGSARTTFDSEATLRQGLTAQHRKLSMDLLPDDRTRASLRTHRVDVSDGNRSSGWQLELEHRVWNEPRIHVGWRHTRYGYRMPGQGGYFNPADYRSNEATVQASGWLPAGLRWQLRWAGGREAAEPGDRRPIRGASASLAWEASPGLELEAAYDHSTSRTLASGGFERGIARLTLRHRH